MIDEKYIELMNREIDGLLFGPELEDLNVYLKENPEAEKYFIGLRGSVKLLNRIPDQLPPAYLKQSIMNSIDRRRYSFERNSFRGIFASLKYLLKPGYAFILAAGIFVGLIVYPLLFTVQKNLVEDKNISGTIGMNEKAVELKAIHFNQSSVSGSIILNKSDNNYWFNAELAVKGSYILNINFNQNDFDINDFTLLGNPEIKISKHENLVSLSGKDNADFRLNFIHKNSFPSVFQIHMTINDDRDINRIIEVK